MLILLISCMFFCVFGRVSLLNPSYRDVMFCHLMFELVFFTFYGFRRL